MITVALIEDNVKLRNTVGDFLGVAGFSIYRYESVECFLEARLIPDCIITDVVLPGMTGIELLETLRAQSLMVPVVVMSGRASIRGAIEAVRKGAFDFLEKPVSGELLVEQIYRSLGVKQRDTALFPEIHCAPHSPMQKVVEQLKPIAHSAASIFIRGETGSGKEVVARALHNSSDRKEGNFIAINCGALAPSLLESELFGYVKGAFTGADRDNPGKIRMADGGTLFLDEIAELPLASQTVLLRVLQERTVVALGSHEEERVDFRLITATHKDLFAAVCAGTFREDLYYRINVFEIELPALRQRTMDIRLLAETILMKVAMRLKLVQPLLSAQEIRTLEQHSWPGNIRELHNVLERFVVTGGVVIPRRTMVNQLTENVLVRKKHEKTGATFDQINDALQQTGGNKSRAAQLLLMSRGAFLYHCKRFNI